MRILVAGASGVIGRRLVPILVDRGHTVIGTATTARSIERIEAAGGEGVLADGLDALAMGRAVALAEPDVAVHEMTALSGGMNLRRFDRTFALTNRLRTDGMDNLVAAARAAGVRKIVAGSYAGWPADPSGTGLVTEDEPFDPKPLRQQRQSLAAIRHLERVTLASPLRSVVLRYGMFYGGEASVEMLDAALKRMLPVIGDGGGVWSFIHVEDAARATAVAIEDDTAYGIYHVVDDDPAPVREIIPALATAVGAKPPRHVPAGMARLLAGDVIVRMMTEARGVSNARIRRELDWRPTWATWRDGITVWAKEARSAGAD